MTRKQTWYEKALDNSNKLPSGCLLFNGNKTHNGYGQVYVRGKMQRLHRLSYQYHKEQIPDGMQVMHSCDNRACWNPDHLILGTPSDNSRDMVNKGRSNKGVDRWIAKLTEDNVREIRKMINEGLSDKSIAEKFLVSRRLISNIKHKEIWKHVE